MNSATAGIAGKIAASMNARTTLRRGCFVRVGLLINLAGRRRAESAQSLRLTVGIRKGVDDYVLNVLEAATCIRGDFPQALLKLACNEFASALPRRSFLFLRFRHHSPHILSC